MNSRMSTLAAEIETLQKDIEQRNDPGLRKSTAGTRTKAP